MLFYKFIYTVHLGAMLTGWIVMKPDSDEDSEEEPCESEDDEWSQ